MKYAIAFTVAVLFLLIGSCSSASDLQLTGHSITVREFTGDLNKVESVAIVTGTATNKGNSVIKDCVVSVTFYDRGNNIVGTSNASRQQMNPGETWNFTAQLKGPDAWKVLSYAIDSRYK